MINYKNVTVKINSSQSENGRKLVSIKQSAEGKLYLSENGWAVVYKEPADTGLGESYTTLRLESDNSVSITRAGDNQVKMVFEEGKHHISRMKLPEGEFSVGMLTGKVSTRFGENGGTINLRYSVSLGSQTPISTVMNITVTPT